MRIFEFFEDDSGRFSQVRLIGFLISSGFMADWMAHVARNIDFDPAWTTVSLVGTIIGVKVWQKRSENGKK